MRDRIQMKVGYVIYHKSFVCYEYFDQTVRNYSRIWSHIYQNATATGTGYYFLNHSNLKTGVTGLYG